MKIGIMTFWWSNDNYGQLLQCYALQKYLRDAGHDAYLIRYDNRQDSRVPLYIKLLWGVNPRKLIRYVEKIIKRKNIAQENDRRQFEEFREKYLAKSERIYTSYRELKNNPPEADVYIVGSDQVWNFSLLSKARVNTIIHAYMLDFGNKSIKRMSYAASWSMDSVSAKLVRKIKPLLQRFSYVSVREEKGVELCRQCGCENAEFVCDPTLLLEADVYRKLYQNENVQVQKQKYILLYMLKNECDFDIQKVYDFAAERKFQIVYVTGNGVLDRKEKFFATIPEWLYLIDNAEYVVTNSYHCSVFSALFSKQFGVVKLKGKFTGMNTRMESLFMQLEIEPRWIQDNFSVLEKEYKAYPVKKSLKFSELLNVRN